MRKDKKSVVLYNIAVPIIAVLLIGGYVAFKNPDFVNQVRDRVESAVEQQQDQEQETEEVEKPNLESTQKVELTESEINALIKTRMSEIDVAGNSVEDANISIDSTNNLITGTIALSNDMTFTFDAEPSADRLGLTIMDLELKGDSESTLFKVFKGPLKTALQKAVDKIIAENAENVEYLEIENNSVLIYIKE